MNEELLLWRWVVGLDYLSIFWMENHKIENLFIFARFYHLIIVESSIIKYYEKTVFFTFVFGCHDVCPSAGGNQYLLGAIHG